MIGVIGGKEYSGILKLRAAAKYLSSRPMDRADYDAVLILVQMETGL